MAYEMVEIDGVQQNNNGTNSNLSPEPEKIDEQKPATTPVQEGSPEGTQQEGEQPADGQGGEDTPADTPAEEGTEVSLYWGDMPIEVEVPEDISSAFAEKGLDVNAVVSELFSKDGKFELTPETRAKLDEAFGKSLVDGYLNLYKQQNQMAVDGFKAQAEKQKAAQESATAEFTDLVGGDEGWAELDAWAAENLSEQELASLNAVMSLPQGHWTAQKTVLEALKMKRDAKAAAANGDDSIKLLGDEGASPAAPAGLPATLTKSEFQELMFSDKYAEDPAYAAQVDAIRRKSQAIGIH